MLKAAALTLRTKVQSHLNQILDAHFKLEQVFLTLSTCLNAFGLLPCVWLTRYCWTDLTGVANKVAVECVTVQVFIDV